MPSLSLVEGWHAPAGRRTCETLASDPGQADQTGSAGGCQKPGPGRQIVSQDSPSGISRIGGQAGTQAPDPTPAPLQNHGSRAGSTIHSLPADSGVAVRSRPTCGDGDQKFLFCVRSALTIA